jgi:hypothetical protein
MPQEARTKIAECDYTAECPVLATVDPGGDLMLFDDSTVPSHE